MLKVLVNKVLGGENLKTYNKITYLVSLILCISYFALRIIYEISGISIFNQISSILSIIVGIGMFIAALKLFFYDKKLKESIGLFIIFIAIAFANIVDYLIK